jgi:hypothetical protein
MFWIKKDNSLGSNNLHLLDDSSIDYKHAQELLDRITWPNIYIFNIFYFFGNGNCKPIITNLLIIAYKLSPNKLFAYKLYAYWLSFTGLQAYW